MTLVDMVQRMLEEKVVHPVHRLDRGTSGVIVFGRTVEATRTMSEAGAMEKRYLALVRGQTPGEGVIDHPIPRKVGGPRVEAVSRYRRLGFVETEPREVSLVEVVLETGRLHQVRRHMKHISHPVIGDTSYGIAALNHGFERSHGLCRLALHAWSVTLVHPSSRESMRFVAPVPDDLALPLSRMGLIVP